MFERSRYNWAITQVETSCKFDYGATEEGLEMVKIFLNSDEVFEMTNAQRKTAGQGWYKALAAVLLSCIEYAREELPPGQRRLYALIFAACAYKAGAIGLNSSPTNVLGDAYVEFGLDRMELAG